MLTIPSHLLINPQALWEALAGERDSPPDLARLPGMLAEIQSHIETLMRRRAACGLVGVDIEQARALRAAHNLLTVLRVALSTETSEEPAGGNWPPGAPFVVVLNGEPRRGSPGGQTQIARDSGSGPWWFAEDERERPPALTPDDEGGR